MILLITEKIPVDVTAIGIMTVLVLTGILDPQEAVRGFSNPAVITVGAMFLISHAMIRTGAVSFIGQKVIAYSQGNPRRAMFLVLTIVALASAFINNTPVVVLFIPVILALSCEFGTSPSKFLIPISYASILAGTCTLIGTSTNIIVSDLSAFYGYGQLSMFELASLGVPIALVGLLFLLLAAPRIMPGQHTPVCEIGDSKHRRYLAELAVPRKSPLVGQDPAIAFRDDFPAMEVFELVRYSHIFFPERDPVRIAPDDVLLVKASANDLVALLSDRQIELTRSEKGISLGTGGDQTLIVELIIPPQSGFLGQKLQDTYVARDPATQVIAIKRSRLHYTEQKIQDVRLRIGDILLIRCTEDNLDRLRTGGDCIVVEDVHHEIVLKGKARYSVPIFAGLVTAATLGLADIMVCALTAVFLMLLTGCLKLRDAYRALQGDVLLLIAGTIALGAAMEKTGTSTLYAKEFLSVFSGFGPKVILTAFLLLTSFSTQILSNNATAVLLLPIAISTALGLGVDPKPFIIAVCFGASACFATPIGYQTNLLVYGPGGYRFSDYLKLGIPLNLIVLAMGALFIPVLWPF